MVSMAMSWRWLPGPARFLRRSGGRFITETLAAASRAAGCDLARVITSVTGPKEAPPRSRISPCSVGGTTAPFTRRATSSSDSPMASFGSTGRTADSCPRSPVPPEIPGDAVKVLRARHDGEGLVLHARTATPRWLGERLDVGWAIDVLHPLALPSA